MDIICTGDISGSKAIRRYVEYMIESVSQKIREKWHTIGLEEGRIEGKEQGIEEGIKTVAKNLIKIGTEDNVIMAVTGLSEEELGKIRTDMPR